VEGPRESFPAGEKIGAGRRPLSIAREVGLFAVLWASSALVLLLLAVFLWFVLLGFPGGAVTAIAVVALLGVAVGLSPPMAFLGSSRWFDAAIVAVAALIFLGAQSRFMDLAQYLAIAFVVAAVVRAAAGRVGGIAPATLLAVALVAAVGGLPWRFAFNVSSTCLEATAESAPTGPSGGDRCRTLAYSRLLVTEINGQRAAWFEGAAPPHPGTINWGIARGIVHSRGGQPECPAEASIGSTCELEPIAEDWYEYVYSTVVWT